MMGVVNWIAAPQPNNSQNCCENKMGWGTTYATLNSLEEEGDRKGRMKEYCRFKWFIHFHDFKSKGLSVLLQVMFEH